MSAVSDKTGWPPGMLQDDCRGLSKWLASKPDARQRAREAAAAIKPYNRRPAVLPSNTTTIRGPLPTMQRHQQVDFDRDRFPREMGQRSSTTSFQEPVNAADLAAQQQRFRDQFNHGDRAESGSHEWRHSAWVLWFVVAMLLIGVLAERGLAVLNLFTKV